jgi:hypothetical protein
LTEVDDTNVTLTLGGSPTTALLAATSLTLGWTGQLATGRGGTGLSSYIAGDLLYYASGTTLTRLGIGAANTVLISSGTAPQWSSSLTVTGLTDSGNLTFTGTGNRITGDFSNATIANRVMFQTSTVNGSTSVSAIPNGTNTQADLFAFNSSDANNAGVGVFRASASEVTIRSGVIGTGTFLPMTFYTGGSEAMRVTTSGNVGIGTSAPAYRLDVRGNGDTSAVVISNSGSNGAALLRLFGSDTGAVYTPFNAVVSSASNGTQHWYIGGDGFANTLVFKTGTPERMRIDSSGNVGIGTSTPASLLTVYRPTAAANPIGSVLNSAIRLQTDASELNEKAEIQFQAGTVAANTGEVIGAISSLYTGFNASNDAGGALLFSTRQSTAAGGLTERMRILSTGNILSLSGGSTTATGTGIAFPATQSASSNANTLDDYEEGSWTPTAGTNTANLNIQNATYTKIGRVVTLNTWIRVDVNAAAFEIGGLPFNVSGRTAISLTNITNNQALGNQLVTATVFGYGATTGLQRDVFIGGVYQV